MFSSKNVSILGSALGYNSELLNARHVNAELHASLNSNLHAAQQAEQSLAALREDLKEAVNSRNDAKTRHLNAQDLLSHKDTLLEQAGVETQHLSDQVSRTCSQVCE